MYDFSQVTLQIHMSRVFKSCFSQQQRPFNVMPLIKYKFSTLAHMDRATWLNNKLRIKIYAHTIKFQCMYSNVRRHPLV